MIRSKPKTKVEPDKPNELAESSFVISVKGFDLKDVQLVADLPSLDMTVSGLALSGGHLYFGSESMEDSFRFHLQGRPTARDAKVRFLGANHRFSKIQFLRGYMDPREPMNLHFALTAMEGDTPVRARAFLGDHGVIVDVTAKNVGRIASRYIPLINLNDGPGSEAHIKIRGTIAEPIAQIQGSGLRFINGYGPSVDNLSGTMLFQRVEGHSTINFLDIKGTTLDATLVADGMWDLLTGNIYTKINGVALNPREFVSASVGARLPHIVDGEVTVRTVFPDVRNVEFGWKMKGKGGDLSYLTSNGSMSYVNGDLDFKSLRIDASEISIRSSGIIGKDRSMAMRGTLTGRNMGRFLKRMGIAPLLSSLDFSGLIRGTVNNPRISGQMTAGGMKAGITTIPALHSHVNINKSGATFAGVNGRLARGKISGSGGVNWSQGFFVFGQGQTKGVELSLLTKGVVKGQLQAHGRVRGQVSRLTGKVTLAMADGAAYGWKLKDAQTAITLKQGAVFIDKGKMELSGSKVTFMGSLLGPKGLGLDVKVAGLNLDALRSPIVTGVINADLGLRGSVTAPYLLGNATLSRARIHGRPAGSDITLRFYREKKTNLFSGNVFNKIAINGQYQSLPKPQSIVTVAFNDMDPALFISPRLLRSYGVDMLLSGSGEAILKPGSFPAATLRVTKARVGMTGIPNKFGPTRPREVLKLGKPLLLTLTKRGIKAHRFNIAGLGTDLDLEAFYDFKQLTGKLDGDVGMTLVPYFMPQGYMERATGSLSLKIAFLQKSDGLDLNGSAYFAGNQLYRSMGGEKITIRAGKITFAPRKLTLDTVRVVYEEEEMVANGQLDLGPWVNPTHMSFDINGLVSSKALFLLAAGSLYSTTGRSRLDLHVSGATTAPQFKGRLKMVENNRIYLRSGREITLAKDSLATFSGPNVRLVGVKVEMEDGFILADGGFTWQKGRPVDMDIALQLRNLVERSSSYEFEMMGNLRLFCQGNDPLTLR
ncbi:hypothetical protein KKF84_04305, partial [Myxococcota bacterium]|nr:hypothetical protein [Myxococcota bacterium]